MEREFELFLREKKFVQNVSYHTIEFYQYSFKVWSRYSSIKDVSDIKKASLITSGASFLEREFSHRKMDNSCFVNVRVIP